MRVVVLASLLLGLAAVAPTAGAADAWGTAANRICTRAFAEAHAYERRVGANQTPAEAIRITHLNVAATTAARRDLARLPRPPAQRARIAQLLHEVDILIGEFRQIESALRRRDDARFRSIAQASVTHSRKANALSRALGATACADA